MSDREVKQRQVVVEISKDGKEIHKVVAVLPPDQGGHDTSAVMLEDGSILTVFIRYQVVTAK